MRVLKSITAAYDRVIGYFAVVAGVLIVSAMLIITLEVVLRRFFALPQRWVVETTEYIMVWTAFLAAAWILRREGHVRVEIVANHFTRRAQAVIGIVVSLIGAALCIVIAVYGSEVVWDFFQRGIRMGTTMAPLKAPFLTIIPIGSILLILQFIRRTGGYVQKLRAGRTGQEQASGGGV
ncbi:MAG: TRAP transporter small permease [Chloroflexi bacterium]|nr:TRAP transporter small permease [Chloroflexota bacterium]